LQQEAEGNPRLSQTLWEIDYIQRPASVGEFLDNAELMGAIGRSIYPKIRSELEYVLDPTQGISEWVASGAIGTGKTTAAIMAQLYKVYELSLMRNPQRYYGIIEGSRIVFALFNIYKYLAQDTAVAKLKAWLKESPYFQRMRKDVRAKDNYWGLANNLGFVIGADAIHALGQDVFGGLLDEADFGREKSMTSEEKGQVESTYTGVRERIYSRFMRPDGRIPGLLCIVSSARDQSDFVERHLERTQNEPGTYVSRWSRWDVKPEIMERARSYFFVYVGDATTRSRILNEGEVAPLGAQIVKVPDQFRRSFEMDVEQSLRDVAGVATYGFSTFLPQREVLQHAVDESIPRRNPWRVVPSRHDRTIDVVRLGLESDLDLGSLFRIDDVCHLRNPVNRVYEPYYHAHMPRYIHVDLAATTDRAGLAMGGTSSIVQVPRVDPDGNPYKVDEVHIWIDFVVALEAPQSDEIDFGKVEQFLFYLRDVCQFPIAGVSYDSWQSRGSLQQLVKSGFEIKTLSVDKDMGPYTLLRAALLEHRIDLPPYPLFVRELGQVQKYRRGKKDVVDHPPRGSKDSADAVAGVAWWCAESKDSVAVADYLAAARDPLPDVEQPDEPIKSPLVEVGVSSPKRMDLDRYFDE
jgi:hypothetical protein